VKKIPTSTTEEASSGSNTKARVSRHSTVGETPTGFYENEIERGDGSATLTTISCKLSGSVRCIYMRHQRAARLAFWFETPQ